ncbi:hypothetical protein FISHEDRAFT_34375 [Fistulina hepatica ATCC 64428]|uniref:Leo1-domain-containing protein n=1 Tax=Fistulina hepatica ATCC 64428 TaxID=1128425 RepID=A0A0D7AMG0_9AGAR|nr:hypothetical protein FISHEDRAFT_34375 [Fistulina hepatica ATCC 64428]
MDLLPSIHQTTNSADTEVHYAGVQASVEASIPALGEHAPAQDEDMDDLFGIDDDVEHSTNLLTCYSRPASPSQGSERLPSEERERRQAQEYPEEEEETAEVTTTVKEADVTFPNIPAPRSSDGENWLLRVPNFVKIDSAPFRSDSALAPPENNAESKDLMRMKSMSIKLSVENTIRWRWQRQSNARFIRWSDGTMSLRLGKEFFDVDAKPEQLPTTPRGPSQSKPATPAKQGLNYLVAQHKYSEILHVEAPITGTMSLRPTGMQSETHRMLVKAVGQKHSKTARLKMAAHSEVAPERELKEFAKQEAKRSRKRSEPRGDGSSRRRRGGSRKSIDTYSDDEEEIFGGSDDDVDSPPRTRRKISREEGPGGGDYQEDDFVVADEAGSDEEGPSRRGHEEVDPLEEMEEKIRRQQHESKRHESPQAAKADEEVTDNDDAMDVESEEEEEEQIRLRRTGPSRRRNLNLDDEEEE